MNMEERILIAKSEILEDLANEKFGYLDIGNFADLHDHVDANAYGGLFDLPFNDEYDENIRICNTLQAALNEWIRSGKWGKDAFAAGIIEVVSGRTT